MSVAIGIPQPEDPSPPTFSAAYSAGRLRAAQEPRRRVQRRRYRHSPNRCHDGQGRLFRTGKLAHQDGPLNLQPYHKEEHGHERVVDPEVQWFVQCVVCESDLEMRVPQFMIAVGPRRIGPNQRHDGAGQQHNSRRRLLGGKPLERAHNMVDVWLFRTKV